MTEIDRLLELEVMASDPSEHNYGLEGEDYREHESLKAKAEAAIKLQVLVKECIEHFNNRNTSISLILSEHLQMMVRASEE